MFENFLIFFNKVQNIVRDKVDKWTNGYKGSTLTSSHQITRTKQT